MWKKVGNDKYQKRSGTVITISSVSSNRTYECDNLSPIPFRAGDTLGVFLPRAENTSVNLLSEYTNTDSPTNYILPEH